MTEAEKLLYDKYVKQSNIPSRYLTNIDLIPVEEDEKAFDRLDNIKNKIDIFVKCGYSLYLYSNNTGNGKTTWATKIALKQIENKSIVHCDYPPALFVDVTDFLNLSKEAISDYMAQEKFNTLINNINNSKLVIWDDIAVKVCTEYELNLLFNLINNRFNEYRTNIFTSNTDINELRNIVGERLADRINNYSINIELVGKSRR